MRGAADKVPTKTFSALLQLFEHYWSKIFFYHSRQLSACSWHRPITAQHLLIFAGEASSGHRSKQQYALYAGSGSIIQDSAVQHRPTALGRWQLVSLGCAHSTWTDSRQRFWLPWVSCLQAWWYLQRYLVSFPFLFFFLFSCGPPQFCQNTWKLSFLRDIQLGLSDCYCFPSNQSASPLFNFHPFSLFFLVLRRTNRWVQCVVLFGLQVHTL